jgi:hypothetical protein
MECAFSCSAGSQKIREAASSIRLPALREASAMNKFVRIVLASSSRLDQYGDKTR